MTKAELIARLRDIERDIEWDDFEVKAAKSDLPKNIRETISAFTDTSGGWIVLGIRQSGDAKNGAKNLTYRQQRIIEIRYVGAKKGGLWEINGRTTQ